MIVAVIEFDDYLNYYPISITKPLWEIRAGLFSFKERIEIFFHERGEVSKILFFTRKNLESLYLEKYSDISINNYDALIEEDEILFLNSTIYPIDKLLALEKNSSLYSNKKFLAAKVDTSFLTANTDKFSSYKNLTAFISEKIDNVKCFENYKFSNNYLWEIIALNGDFIREDFNFLSEKNQNNIKKDVTIVGNKNLCFIEDDVQIDPLVVFDVSKGPIVVKKGTVINSFSRIEGPAFIGENCIILGAKIREGTSIGNFCRVGGEVEDSIIYGYSNKYHDGFIGHAYIGEWVNLGAMTTNSDLKNNYKTVKVYIPEKRINTGLTKVGALIGDFTKASIGTLINTGTSIGVGAMLVFDGGLTPHNIPCFSWFVKSSINNKEWVEDFIDSGRTAMGRRGVKLTPVHESFLRELYLLTSNLREKEAKKWLRNQK